MHICSTVLAATLVSGTMYGIQRLVPDEIKQQAMVSLSYLALEFANALPTVLLQTCCVAQGCISLTQPLAATSSI